MRNMFGHPALLNRYGVSSALDSVGMCVLDILQNLFKIRFERFQVER